MADPTLPHTPHSAQSTGSLTGRVVAGRYRVERAIGRGGMGVVHRAVHLGLEKRVAIKFIADKYTEDAEALARFRREARAASRIGHESIVDVTDVGDTEDGRCFIVMELLEGADLAEVARQTGPMPAPRALAIAEQILAGLGAAHEAGIVHRDMKPENVFLARRGGRDDVVKIMDFGISKFLVALDSKVRLTETGAIIGTPVYMAPEQAQALPDLDHRVDIYAVGVMLYEMLAGRPPFTAPSYLALVTQHLHDEPPPLQSFRPDLPGELVAAIHRALEKDPARRFRDCAEFAAALPDAGEVAALMAQGTTVASASQAFRPPRARPKRRWWPWAAAAAVLLAAGGASLAVALSSEAPAEAPARAAAPEPATLEVASMPAGAAVYLDGERVGETPLTLREVPAGEHQIRLEKAGYATLVSAKTVRDGYRESFVGVLSAAGVVAADAGAVRADGEGAAAMDADARATQAEPGRADREPGRADREPRRAEREPRRAEREPRRSQDADRATPAPTPQPAPPQAEPEQPPNDRDDADEPARKPNPYLR